jgi:hypothetical protein
MGIRNDDESIENLNKLEDKADRAIFFTEKGTKVPDTLKPIVWDLAKQRNDKFKFDASLVVTNKDLSNISYLEGINYKETTVQGCAKLALEPVELDIQNDEATNPGPCQAKTPGCEISTTIFQTSTHSHCQAWKFDSITS